MKYSLITILLIAPFVARANHTLENGSFALWVAIGIGIVASFLVLKNAYCIGPSLLRRVYMSFGIGMLVIVLGLVVMAVPEWTNVFVVERVRDMLFILGFGLMASGAGRMLLAVGLR